MKIDEEDSDGEKMAWFELLQEIEPFDELPFDRALVEALEDAARGQPLGVLRFFTPTFRSMPTTN